MHTNLVAFFYRCQTPPPPCSHSHNNVVSAALRAVGNIVTGNDTQTQLILNCNALPSILQLLSSTKEAVRKEACWTISNIAAGNRNQIQAAIDANIFPSIIDLLQKADFKTRKEAAWAITNATSGGTVQQIKYLVGVGQMIRAERGRWMDTYVIVHFPNLPNRWMLAAYRPCASC